MSKILIKSIQGVQSTLYENNGLEQFNSNMSHIEVEDLATGNKLDWKLGIFTQGKGHYLTEEEVTKLHKDYDFIYVDLDPYENTLSKDAIVWASLLNKLGITSDLNYESDTDDCRTRKVFEGYIVIGEIELEKVIELNKCYNNDIINSSSFKSK